MKVKVKKRHRKNTEAERTASGCVGAMRILDTRNEPGKEERKILEIIRQTLEDMNIPFEEHFNTESYIFMLLLHTNDPAQTLCLRILLQKDPLICKMTAIYPFRVDRNYLMPVSCLIRDINWGKYFGNIQLDAREGLLTCSYGFPTDIAHLESCFEELVVAVVQSVNDRYGKLRRWAGGDFDAGEKNRIICQLQQQILVLANNISD